MKKQNKLHDLIAAALMILFCLYIMSACSIHPIHQIAKKPEQFIYKDQDIYHVSSVLDTTALNWSDLKVLQIDSLQDKYLELNAEK